MSGSADKAGGSNGSDPSMEDILASIRRILSEDETPPPSVAEPPPAEPAAAAQPEDDVLVLDTSMLVKDDEPEPPAEPPLPNPTANPRPDSSTLGPSQDGLLAPEAAAAASTSVSHLVNTLTADRGTRVYHGGPTIEDLVREELRPLLKQWLDANLPPMVERLVRVEIERVVARVVP